MLWTPKEEEPGSSIHSMLNMYKIKWKKGYLVDNYNIIEIEGTQLSDHYFK